MTASKPTAPDAKRHYYRTAVRWTAACEHASGHWSDCVILDASAFGMFLSPASGAINELADGDVVRIYFRTTDFVAKEVEVIGTVRWSGWSETHDCEGVGIQFESMCHEIACAITPRFRPEAGSVRVEGRDPIWTLAFALN